MNSTTTKTPETIPATPDVPLDALRTWRPPTILADMLADVVALVDRALVAEWTAGKKLAGIERQIREIHESEISDDEALGQIRELRDREELFSRRHEQTIAAKRRALAEAKTAEIAAYTSEEGIRRVETLLAERPGAALLAAALDDVERALREIETEDRALLGSIRARDGRTNMTETGSGRPATEIPLSILRSWTVLAPAAVDHVVRKIIAGTDVPAASLDPISAQKVANSLPPWTGREWLDGTPVPVRRRKDLVP